MSHRIACTLLLLALIAAPPRHAAADDVGPVVAPLLSTGTTIVGETLHYPTGAPAHVTASIITLAPGGRTILHRHGVPMFAYILDGEITVDYGERGTRIYRKGEALMEAMDVPHFGTATGPQAVRILVVYMGAEGAADVIPAK